jgi:hypothetical protein
MPLDPDKLREVSEKSETLSKSQSGNILNRRNHL